MNIICKMRMLSVLFLCSSSVADDIVKANAQFQTLYTTYSDIDVISDSLRERLRSSYEELMKAPLEKRTPPQKRALDLILKYDNAISLIPITERQYLTDHGTEIGWIEVTELESVGFRITALGFNIRPEVPKDIHDHKISAAAQELPSLRYLRGLFFNGAVKEGVQFERLGNLSELKEFQPPVDVSDDDLLAMKNLRNLASLDIGGRSDVDGRFLSALIDNGRLRFLYARASGMKSGFGALLLKMNELESVYLPNGLVSFTSEELLSLEVSGEFNLLFRGSNN